MTDFVSNQYLLVDDHPFIIEAYQNAIKSYCQSPPHIQIAEDCRSGYDYITTHAVGPEVAFLDISMPHYLEQNIKSGIDLARLIRVQWPNTKVVILSMHSEIMDIEHIIQTLKPNGMIIKNDLGFADLLYILDRMHHNDHFYSDTIVRMMRHPEFRELGINQSDRSLLRCLLEDVPLLTAAQNIGLHLQIAQKRVKTLAYILEVDDVENLILLAQTAEKKGLLL